MSKDKNKQTSRQENGEKNSKIRRRMLLSCSTEALLKHEASYIYQRCEELLSDHEISGAEQAYFLISMAALLLGQTHEALSQYPIHQQDTKHPPTDELCSYAWIKTDSCIFLRLYLNIPRQNYEEQLIKEHHGGLLNTTKTLPLDLPLPQIFLDNFHLIENCTWAGIKRIQKKAMKKIRNGEIRKIKYSHISSFAKYFYARTSSSIFCQLFLIAHEKEYETGKYYCQAQSHDILNIYSSLYSFLTKTTLIIDELPNKLVGSSLVLKGLALTFIFKELCKKIAPNYLDAFHFFKTNHNFIAYYCKQLVSLSIASRGENNSLGTVLNFDLNNPWCLTEEKIDHETPLGKMATQQIKAYKNYLENIYLVIRTRHPEYATIIFNALTGTDNTPLFFGIEGEEKTAKPISLLKNITKNTLPFIENVFRHTMYSYMAKILTHEELKAFAGHSSGGQELDADFSGLTHQQTINIRNAVDGFLKTHNIPVLMPNIESGLDEFSKNEIEQQKEKLRSKLTSSDNQLPIAKQIEATHYIKGFEGVLKAYLDDTKCDPNIWRLLTLFSAMKNGGLLDIKFLSAFAKRLSRPLPLIEFIDGKPFIELSYLLEGAGHFNKKINDASEIAELWPIDPITLNLILQRDKYIDQIISIPDRLLFQDFQENFSNIPRRFGCIKNLKELSFEIANIIQRQNPFINECSKNCLTGKVTNFGPSRTSFLNLHHAPEHVVLKASECRTEVAEVYDPAFSLSSPEYNHLKNDIRDILNSSEDKMDASKALQEFLISPYVYIPEILRYFVEWLIFKLTDGKGIKTTTASGYFSTAGVPLLDAFELDDICDLDPEPIYEILEKILKAKTTDQNNDTGKTNIHSTLGQFYTYMVEVYDAPTNDDLMKFINTEIIGTFVRTGVIDYRYIESALCVLDRSFYSELYKTQLKIILTLGYRLGFRISEILALQFNDIILLDKEYVAHIRFTNSGTLKTKNARRFSFLSTLLTEKELDLFCQYYWQMQVGKPASNLIFGAYGDNLLLNRSSVSADITAIMRRLTRDGSWVFHNFRRSFSSNLILIFNASKTSYTLAEKYTGLQRPQLIDIRETLIGPKENCRDIFWIHSKALGHAEPKFSLLTYVHTIKFAAYEALHEQAWDHPLINDVFIKLAGFKSDTLKEMDRKDALERVLTKHVGSHCLGEHKQINYLNTISPKYNFERPDSLTLFTRFLEDIETGDEPKKVSKQYGFCENKIRNLYNNAQTLMQKKAIRENGFKLRELIIPDEKYEILLPDLPSTPHGKWLASRLFNHFRKMIEGGHKREAMEAIEIVLKGYTYSHSELKIFHYDEFNCLAELLNPIIPKTHWFGEGEIRYNFWCLEQNTAAKRAKLQWKTICDEHTNITEPEKIKLKKRSTNPHGTMKMTLAHKPLNQLEENSRTEGVKVLVYAAFMVKASLQ